MITAFQPLGGDLSMVAASAIPIFDGSSGSDYTGAILLGLILIFLVYPMAVAILIVALWKKHSIKTWPLLKLLSGLWLMIIGLIFVGAEIKKARSPKPPFQESVYTGVGCQAPGCKKQATHRVTLEGPGVHSVNYYCDEHTEEQTQLITNKTISRLVPAALVLLGVGIMVRGTNEMKRLKMTAD